MMTVQDLFNLANKYHVEGNNNMARQLWLECIKSDPNYGPAYVNLGNLSKVSGNLAEARQFFERFLACPLTGYTFKILPRIEEELINITNQLTPKPVEQPK